MGDSFERPSEIAAGEVVKEAEEPQPESEPLKDFEDLDPAEKVRAILAETREPLPGAIVLKLAGIHYRSLPEADQERVAEVFNNPDARSGTLAMLEARNERVEARLQTAIGSDRTIDSVPEDELEALRRGLVADEERMQPLRSDGYMLSDADRYRFLEKVDERSVSAQMARVLLE